MLIGIDASRAVNAERTGTEAYAYYLIRHLVPLAVDQGHQIRLYFNTPPADTLFSDIKTDPQVEFRQIPFPRLWTHFRLGLELALHPPDLFFTPAHVIPITWIGKSIATIHDLGYEHYPETHTPSQLRQLRWSTKHNARRSRLILADSKATKQDLVSLYGTPSEKIHVVYPGITFEGRMTDDQNDRMVEGKSMEKVDDQPTVSRHRIPPTRSSPPHLLFLSTIQPRKNVSRIIEAFAALADEIPHQLILVGRKGWRSEPIFEQIEALPEQVRSRIIHLGYVDEQTKWDLLHGADLFLYPSLYEGFGFPLLEANACGTPVITANSSSLAELAETGGALAIDPLDVETLKTAIKRLLHENKLREGLIINGYANIERFQWPNTAQTVLKLINSLS